MRDLRFTLTANNGNIPLFSRILVPEILKALDSLRGTLDDCVIIGGVAFSFWAKPRTTQDVDLLLLSDKVELPSSSFKKIRQHAWMHKSTHVEIEILTPSFLKLPTKLCAKILDTAVESDGLKIANPSGIVASKLFRYSTRDISDIVELLKCQHVDCVEFDLPRRQTTRLASLRRVAQRERESDV